MAMDTKFLATAIGSLPHPSAEKAVDIVLDKIPDCPVWPQLPKLGLREQMEIQYSEALPCVEIDEAKGRMYFNTADEDRNATEMAAFYEKYMAAQESDNWSAFAISNAFSKGIYALEHELARRGLHTPWLKVQTTGPLSIGLSIVDENKRAIYYNEAFRDCIVKGLAAKCRWQIEKFKEFTDDIICFIDEPILSAFGSSTYVSVQRDEVVAAVAEVAEAIHGAGALCGVHCCGNTEWPILIDAGVDIINFDAYGFGESMALYAKEIDAFLKDDKIIAWGIVPTSDKVANESVGSLIAKYDECVERLAAKGVDKQLIHRQSMLTPSCGTGSLSEVLAEKVFDTLNKVSKELKLRL
jgi:methionine synthase II (cobalamin-independent)